MRRFKTLSEFSGMQGSEIGVSDWLTVTQDRIDGFAHADRGPPMDSRRS